MGNRKFSGEIPYVLRLLPGTQRDVRNCPARLAEKMRVLIEVWAIPGGLPFVAHGLHETAGGEGIEAIVNGCQGDVRDRGSHAGEDLDRGGMIALAHEHVINGSALTGHAQPMTVDGFVRRWCWICRCRHTSHPRKVWELIKTNSYLGYLIRDGESAPCTGNDWESKKQVARKQERCRRRRIRKAGKLDGFLQRRPTCIWKRERHN